MKTPKEIQKTVKESFSIDLVIARYQEDISWLTQVRDDVRVFLYEKYSLDEPHSDHSFFKRELLPNIGNEAHTYVYHIVENYSSPADLTFFVQGRPFDHSPEALLYINGEKEINQDYTTICSWITTSDTDGAPHAQGLPVGAYYENIFRKPMTEIFTFGAGAQFCVTKKAIISKPIEFWEKLLELSKNTHEAPFVFERLWHKFFEFS